MKKHVLFLAILITALCATAYASSSNYWDDGNDDGGTDSQGGGEVALEKLYILLFQGSGQSGNVFLINGKVSYPADKTLQIKALESSSAEPVELFHMGSEQYCKNTSEFILNTSMELCDEVKEDIEKFCSDIDHELSAKYCSNKNPDYSKISEYDGLYDTTCKIDSLLSGNNYICIGSLGYSYINYCVKPQYNGEQSFTCSLSTGANPALTENSKIKLQFFAKDKAVAETDPFEIKDALNGEVAFENGIKTLTYVILEELKGEEANLEDAPIEHKDSDGDGQDDIVDDFPSLFNNGSASPITINADTDSDGVDTEDDGGDCSLNPAATANGLGWLVDILILGMPAALFGFRRK